MIQYINNYIIGPILPVFLGLSGIILLFYFRFKPITKIKKLIQSTDNNAKKSESIKSLFLGLSGTLGVGNIAGVAAAIAVGGSGSVFWMWFFGLLAMVIKYSEVVLSAKYNSEESGGAANYIDKGLRSKCLAGVYSILIIITSISVGNVVQSSAASESLNVCFQIPKIQTGVIIAIVTLLLVYGGRERVSRFSSAVIPILCLAYVIISIAIIISNISLIPEITLDIISNAFNAESCGGGFLGIMTSKAFRFGASRGVLSNEAGCGTICYAHSNSSGSPAKQGVWGMMEVFIDTILLCTLTAFVVLIYKDSLQGKDNGMMVAISAYGHIGDIGSKFIGISSAIFALASIVCWSYYGLCALDYLKAKKNTRILYLFVYSITGIVGSIFAPKLVWEISDLVISALAIYNLTFVLLLSKEVKKSIDSDL